MEVKYVILQWNPAQTEWSYSALISMALEISDAWYTAQTVFISMHLQQLYIVILSNAS